MPAISVFNTPRENEFAPKQVVVVVTLTRDRVSEGELARCDGVDGAFEVF